MTVRTPTRSRQNPPRLLLLLLAGALAGGGGGLRAAAPAPQRVRLQLKWRHQFQFAGYYAALHKGYYREAGLEVEIQEPGGWPNPVDSVLKGKSDFGIYGTDLLRYRAEGVPLVAVAAIFQHSPAALVCRRDRGISQLPQIAGKRIALEPDTAELLAYLKANGLPTNVFTNPFDFAEQEQIVSQFLQGRVDGMSIYTTDELFSLAKTNLQYVLFSPREAGIDFYADILFTTEQTLARDPEMVRAFRAATLKGWQYALAHRAEMADLILAKYTTRHSREHLLFEAERMEPLLAADVVEIGYMNPDRWRAIADTYAGLGMLGGKVDWHRFLYSSASQPVVIRYWKEALAALLLALAALLLSWRYSRLAQSLKRENAQRQATEALLRQEVAERKEAQAQLQRRTDELEQALGRVTKLQTAVLRMCAWTKQVHVDGKWVPVDKYLHDTLGINITHGLSEEAAQQLLREMEPPKA
jgi:two-component system, sensor histidine kinase and response regulator